MDGSGNWLETNVHAGGQFLAQLQPPGITFRYTDHLGTLRAWSNAAGALVGTCASLPFGETTTCTNTPEYFFTGKERDGTPMTESGNDYFEARYYNSSVGRFLSPDWSAKVEPVPYSKLGDPQSLNLYAYVQNNPLGGVDPDGHVQSQDDPEQGNGNQQWWATNHSELYEDMNRADWVSSGSIGFATKADALEAQQWEQASGGSPQQKGGNSNAKLRIPLMAVALENPPTRTLNSERGREVDYGLFEIKADGSPGLRNKNFTIGLNETLLYGKPDEICDHSNCSDSSGTLHDVQRALVL